MRFQFSFKEHDPKIEAIYGTILTLGNGHIGIRGEIELEPTIYGTTIAGVYDYTPYFYREIVNAPRVIGLQIFFNGEPICLSTQKILKYERELNIDNATLKTKIELKTQNNTQIQYESLRIVHGERKNLVLLKFRVKTSEDGILTIISPIETNVVNPSYRNEIMVRHFKVKELEDKEDGVYAEVETLDGKYKIGIASSLMSKNKAKRVVAKPAEGIAEILTLKVEKDRTYEFIKYVVVLSSEVSNLKERAFQQLQEAKSLGFDKLYDEHKEYWRGIWERAKIEIEGDEKAERGLNFSIFHLIQSMPVDSRISLTARGIHGFGYRGHVFWDTEIYALPFFMAVFPEKAREMLMYRYNNLNAARENAKLNGYKGAQFPWESADDGHEATPSVIPLDVIGKEAVRIYTGEEEHHITADIAYAVELYYKLTGDEEFMSRYGLEIILETARFWASRVKYDEKKGYVIEKVIGPDEYHEHVNNSFFTNLMAKYNLILAAKYFEIAKSSGGEWSKTLKRVNVNEKEAQEWLNIAKKIYIPRQENGIFEEFDGYFDLIDYTLDPYGLGEKRLPEEIRKNLGKTKIIKQADVIAAQYLLKKQFNLETIKKNFDYYIIRTTHASSLSMPAYAIIASWLGYEDLAYDYFMKCAFIDLHNIYGNTQDGLHLATAGGVWQIVFRGFCGIDINNDRIEVNPKLPKKWKAVKLKFFFKGALLSLEVRKDAVRAKLLNGKEVKIRAFDKDAVVKRGEEIVLHK